MLKARHHGFSPLTSVECACVPEYTTYAPVTNLCITPKSQIFSQPSNLYYELKNVHNCLIWQLLVWCSL